MAGAKGPMSEGEGRRCRTDCVARMARPTARVAASTSITRWQGGMHVKGAGREDTAQEHTVPSKQFHMKGSTPLEERNGNFNTSANISWADCLHVRGLYC